MNSCKVMPIQKLLAIVDRVGVVQLQQNRGIFSIVNSMKHLDAETATQIHESLIPGHIYNHAVTTDGNGNFFVWKAVSSINLKNN